MGHLTGIFDVLLLIGLGVGYLVIYFAKREERILQFIGYIIGVLILTIVMFYMFTNLWFRSQFNKSYPRYHKGMMMQK